MTLFEFDRTIGNTLIHTVEIHSIYFGALCLNRELSVDRRAREIFWIKSFNQSESKKCSVGEQDKQASLLDYQTGMTHRPMSHRP